MGVVRGVQLRLGLSLRFGSGLRIRIGVRRCRGRARGWTGGRSRSRWNVAPSLMPLHVPHTSDGLDLRCSGSPSVPVLEVSMFKNVLAPSVAWIRVSHPPSQEKEWFVKWPIMTNNLVKNVDTLKVYFSHCSELFSPLFRYFRPLEYLHCSVSTKVYLTFQK